MRSKFFVVIILFLAQLASTCITAATNAFLEAGIPAADREWRGSDYMLAAQIFTDGKVTLPRFSDEQGSLLLERLTSIENFSFQRNKTLPFGSRMEDYLNLTQGANSILKLYLTAANKGKDVHKEMARLQAFELHVAALGVELVDEFMPTIPKDDKYAVRMDGLKKMYSGLTTVFVGAEASLTERKFSPDDKSTMLEAMTNTLPQIKKTFSADYAVELRKKLESDKSKFKSNDDINRINKMLAELGN